MSRVAANAYCGAAGTSRGAADVKCGSAGMSRGASDVDRNSAGAGHGAAYASSAAAVSLMVFSEDLDVVRPKAPDAPSVEIAKEDF